MTSRIGPDTRARIDTAWPELLQARATGALAKDVLAAHAISRPMLVAYMAGNAELRAQWDSAGEASADAFMDEALEIARGDLVIDYVRDSAGEVKLDKRGHPILIRGDSAHARTRIDTLKWAARVRNPKAYGDKAQLDVNVKHVDLTRIIAEANARLAHARAPRVIDAQVLDHDASERAIARELTPHDAGERASVPAALLALL